MTDPIRLLEGDGDDFECELLASARRDRASERARLRALAVFGTVGLNLAATTAAASPSAFVAAATGGFATAPTSVLALGTLAKWLGTGVLAGTISVGSVYAIRESRHEATTPPRAAAPGEPVSPRAKVAAPRALEPEPPAVAPRDEPRGVPREPERASDLPPPALPPGIVSSSGAFPIEPSSLHLSEELAALERARRSLRRGDPSGALAELGRYEARFPRGALSHEATLLTVEAKLDAGDVNGARAVAARVLAVDGTSPHARRIRALFEAKGIR